MEACKQQNHGSMQAAEPWMHASSRTTVACKQQNHASSRTEASKQAAEPWKHASSRTEACKQQNHRNMQAGELKHESSRTIEACMQAGELKHASSRTMEACKQVASSPGRIFRNAETQRNETAKNWAWYTLQG